MRLTLGCLPVTNNNTFTLENYLWNYRAEDLSKVWDFSKLESLELIHNTYEGDPLDERLLGKFLRCVPPEHFPTASKIQVHKWSTTRCCGASRDRPFVGAVHYKLGGTAQVEHYWLQLDLDTTHYQYRRETGSLGNISGATSIERGHDAS